MSFKRVRKVLSIGFIGGVLWIALITILSVVSERSERREDIYKEMAQLTAGSQILGGPFLVLPYELQSSSTIVDENGVRKTKVETTRHAQYILPKELKIHGDLGVQKRYRSLYEILLYTSNVKLEGRFEFVEAPPVSVPQGSSIKQLSPFLLVLVKDSRGVTQIPVLKWNGADLAVKPGNQSQELGLSGGFHAELSDSVRVGGTFPFAIDLNLLGTQSFSWLPIGEETKVTLKANWPHPSFQGLALPQTHRITSEGFEADWESTHFSTNIAQLISEPAHAPKLAEQGVGFKLIQPVDIYQQTERSVKYGFLFIALTFAVFLALETLKSLSIHPIQYAFVGLALVIFYVLLLALSEHILFVQAYTIASLSSVSLLAFYIRYVVHSWKISLGFALSLGVLDGLIYGILISEDYALLYGSLLLFALLAAAMISTRRVNWNELSVNP